VEINNTKKNVCFSTKKSSKMMTTTRESHDCGFKSQSTQYLITRHDKTRLLIKIINMFLKTQNLIKGQAKLYKLTCFSCKNSIFIYLFIFNS